MLKTTIDRPITNPMGSTIWPAIRIKIINPLAIKRRKYLAMTRLCEDKYGGVRDDRSVRANR